MSRDQYQPGLHRIRCDICAKTRLSNMMRMQWDNLVVCSDTCWSPKHPNEFPRPQINDGLPVPNARPRNTVYITFPAQTTWNSPGLLWTNPTWRWDDDESQNSLFTDGNP